MSKLLKNGKKGFTLIEMLIVVAIIVILVAIMIPSVTSQLERAREAADIANIRSAYAEAMITALTSEDGTGKATTPTMVQTTSGWKYVTWPDYLNDSNKGTAVAVKKGDTVTVTINADGTNTVATGTGAGTDTSTPAGGGAG